MERRGVAYNPYIFPVNNIHGPGAAGEWGSGGIFGLTVYRGVLYYTLAFDAKAYFIRLGGGDWISDIEVYDFCLVCGGGSSCSRRECHRTSGGDTYNAVASIDNYIYFGGWVHAPVKYLREGLLGRLDFTNKYSHVHRYDIDEHKIELVWREGLGSPDKWAGEISDIIYDPLENRLLLPRGDGMERLGVYMVEPGPRDGNKAVELSDRPCLKGAIYYDYACFDISRWDRIRGFQCYDLVERKWSIVEEIQYPLRAVDGEPVEKTHVGHVNAVAGKLVFFVKSGMLIAEPFEEEWGFARLLDFTDTHYTPSRTKPLVLGGGVLTAYSPYTHAVLFEKPGTPSPHSLRANDVVGPSLLVYYTPPAPRIVAALGARVTGLEALGDKILVATNTWANMGGRDASLIDHGYRSIVVLPQSILASPPPPVTIRYRPGLHGRGVWGGIPLTGYREPVLRLRGIDSARVTIYEYDAGTPPMLLYREDVVVRNGEQLDLSGYGPIVSFSTNVSAAAVFIIELR